MALRVLTRALGSLSLTPPAAAASGPSLLQAAQVILLEIRLFLFGVPEKGHRGWEARDANLVRIMPARDFG